ncbi:MAG TPA: hypothetical protein VF820_00645, partial [Patescibacteria group bacterium]
VYIASAGISLLIGILLMVLWQKSRKWFGIAVIAFIGLFTYYSYLNIQNQTQALADMVMQRTIPDKIFAMVPRNGEKKLLFSANPTVNAIEAKIGGPTWLYAFYKFSELTYTNSLDNFVKISSLFDLKNIYVFYNNPPTMTFKNISDLAKNEITSKKLPTINLLPSFSIESQMLQKQSVSIINRGTYVSPDLNTRFFLPRNISFTVRSNMQSFVSPYFDLYIVGKTLQKPLFPLSLWNYVEDSPIISSSDEINKKLALPMDNSVQITSFLPDSMQQALSILNTRELYRKEAQVSVSDIEPASEMDPNINNITTAALFDGKYTPKNSPDKGKFYRANTTPTTITITLPQPVALGRILLNVPPGSNANAPVNVTVINPQTHDTLFSGYNITSIPGSPNNGLLYELPLYSETTNTWEIHITKTTHNPIMLDEIILDPQEALTFTPLILFENKWASFHYINGQNVLTELLSNSQFNAMTVFYACAEESDWNLQKKDMTEETPGIWKAVQISLNTTTTQQVSAPIDCYGSVLRKLIFVAPAYSGAFQIQNVSLIPHN